MKLENAGVQNILHQELLTFHQEILLHPVVSILMINLFLDTGARNGTAEISAGFSVIILG